MPSRRLRKIRQKLFDADPHCYWCNGVTRWVVGDGRSALPDDAATLDHFRPRFDPLRNRVPNEPQIVLAHYRCNHDRHAQQPQIHNINRGLVQKYSDPVPLRVPLGEITALRELQARYTELVQEVQTLVHQQAQGAVA